MNQNQNQNQFTVPGTISESRGGTEIIKFTVKLGIFWLRFIVNIPEPGKTEAPVYVKYGVLGENNERVVSKPQPKPKPDVVHRPRRMSRLPRVA